jgi:hypothetical protein
MGEKIVSLAKGRTRQCLYDERQSPLQDTCSEGGGWSGEKTLKKREKWWAGALE